MADVLTRQQARTLNKADADGGVEEGVAPLVACSLLYSRCNQQKENRHE